MPVPFRWPPSLAGSRPLPGSRWLAPSAVLAFGATSGAIAGAEPMRSGAHGVAPEAWVGGWAVVAATLSVLYVFDRRHRASLVLAARRVSPVPMSRDHIVPIAALAAAAPGAPAEAPRRRTIEELIKRKPGAPADSPLPLPLRSSGRPSPPEALRERLRAQAGELLAAERDASPAEAAPEEPEAASLVEAEYEGEEEEEEVYAPAEALDDAETEAAPAPSCLERCAALREAGQHEAAARVARTGLASHSDPPGPLLLELSRAELALGRHDSAIDTARDALFVWRSRESIENLMRTLTALRRFEPGDGATLRRAALRHPHQPLLRHAAGVFELLHGSLPAAETQLRAALALAPDAESRAALERDLAHAKRLAATRS